MIRQGNENEKVHVYTYVTEGTFDAYLYQLVQQKQTFISQIMTSKTPVRTMEDIDEKALSYGEIKALATGNEKIKDKTRLDSEVAKLKLLKQSFMNQKYQLQDKIAKFYPSEISRLTNNIKSMEEDTTRLKGETHENADGFSPMIINGITYTKKEDAGKALLKECQMLKSMEVKTIGNYRGFEIQISYDSMMKIMSATLKNKFSYQVELGTDTFGNITRINNVLDGIEERISKTELNLENIKKQEENAKEEVKKDFPKEQELKDKQAELAEINKELKIDEEEHEIVDEDEEKKSKDLDKTNPERC